MSRAEKSKNAHKDAAWKAFSHYIRVRDCLKTTGDPTRGHCCTCPVQVLKTDGHAGHFLAGRGNAILFDERGTNLQCFDCNIGLNGNYDKYLEFMLKEHGQEVVDEIERLKRSTLKIHNWEFKEIERRYKSQLAQLLAEYKRNPISFRV